MTAEKLREQDTAALEANLADWSEQIQHLKFRLTMGQNEGIKKVRELKKDRARILTILGQRKKQ